MIQTTVKTLKTLPCFLLAAAALICFHFLPWEDNPHPDEFAR